MATTYHRQVSDAELLEKNRIYDTAADDIWRRVVYDPVHGGWEFTNMGGRRVLDYVGRLAQASPGRRVVELCSGLGDTCRYLARGFDCHVTGVELNPRQLARAREKAGGDAAAAGKIEFVESDIRSWEPARPFDVAFSLDSLMLVNDVKGVLPRVRAALEPGGAVALAEMTAGPKATEELLERVWELDGMITIPEPRGYVEMLEEAGFSDVAVSDLTGLAADCFRRMSGALREQKGALLETVGAAEHEGWSQLTDFYHGCFLDGRFTYSLVTARR